MTKDFRSAAAAGISVLLLAGCAVSASSPDERTDTSTAAVITKCGTASNGPVQGVDVSVWQGNDFGWSAASVQFGYARVSYGADLADDTFDGNWAAMKAAGVLRGPYQYFVPSEDATAQANVLVAKVGRLGAGDLPAMIDVEETDGVSGASIGAAVQTWLEIVEQATGKRPIIYTGAYFWEDDIGAGLSLYPVWIADYGPGCPLLPQDGWSNWLFWQYSDGDGSLDHDVFNGTLEQLQAFAGVVGGDAGASPQADDDSGATLAAVEASAAQADDDDGSSEAASASDDAGGSAPGESPGGPGCSVSAGSAPLTGAEGTWLVVAVGGGVRSLRRLRSRRERVWLATRMKDRCLASPPPAGPLFPGDYFKRASQQRLPGGREQLGW